MNVAASSCTGECLKSGPWGLAIVLLLGVACYFLYKSMSKRIKRIREQQMQPPATPSKPAESSAPRAEIVPPPVADTTSQDDRPDA